MRPSGLVMLLACGVTALVPLFAAKAPAAAVEETPAWPERFAGKPLRALPLSDREKRFLADFPGHIRRFSDGEREIVIRWVSRETRRLHAAADCFRGAGYAITPQPLAIDADGARWARFIAHRGDERLEVRERIHDSTAGEWTDVSAWYWAAATGRSQGPWWAITVASAAP